jgi:Asp-tRNA(Asn)/Glu-tRNA(Gln) amidotransferase A subunit family amidase
MSSPSSLNRRGFLALCSSIGFSAVLADSLWARVQQQKPTSPGTAPAGTAEGRGESAHQAATEIAELPANTQITSDMVRDAAAVAGLHFNDAQIEMMLKDINDQLQAYRGLWALHLPNSVAPALVFNPVLPGMSFPTQRQPMRLSRMAAVAAPARIEEVAFYNVRQLGELLRTRQISSVALTEMYVARLKRYDPVLHFVITLTEERAIAQARQADREIAAGKYRGPLHGIPWGAKDLLAVADYRTTWGAGGFEQQKINETATVVKRLDDAGAVLVAKLTLGALAQGDVWFGGVTRNPWKTDQGSSGSSAGSSSAVAAGCVGFAIGSETLGSISSPSTRNGVTGLRPTFGLVPRTGAMALSWSMDKLGPICRSVEDCALVLSAICGPDGHDRSVHDVAFNWDGTRDPRSLRIGYLKADFEHEPSAEELKNEKPEQRAHRLEARQFDQAALDVLQHKMGLGLATVEMPSIPPARDMRFLLVAEAAAAFDDLTRSGRDRLLTAQGPNDWPNTFREARVIPAVEYINANRARTLLMEKTADVFSKFDVIVAPTFSPQLLITNLTGHPALILPNGFRQSDGTPVSLTFLGGLFGEVKMCALAMAYQNATGFHLKHPKISDQPTPAFLPKKD